MRERRKIRPPCKTTYTVNRMDTKARQSMTVGFFFFENSDQTIFQVFIAKK